MSPSPSTDLVGSMLGVEDADYGQPKQRPVRKRSSSKNAGDHEQESSGQEQPPLEIVWRNVAIMIYLHMAAVYGCYLAFTVAKAATNFWGTSFFLSLNFNFVM